MQLLTTDPRIKHYLTSLTKLVIEISRKLGQLSLDQIDGYKKNSQRLFKEISSASSSVDEAMAYMNKHKQESYIALLECRKNKINDQLKQFDSSTDSEDTSSNLFRNVYDYLEEKVKINMVKSNLIQCVSPPGEPNINLPVSLEFFTNLIDHFYVISRYYQQFISVIESQSSYLSYHLTEFKLLMYIILNELLFNIPSSSSNNAVFDDFFSVMFRPITIEQHSNIQSGPLLGNIIYIFPLIMHAVGINQLI
jgi:hypothetical protein